MRALLKADYKLLFSAVFSVLRDTFDISYISRSATRWYKIKFYLFAVIPGIFRGKYHGRNAFLFNCRAVYSILKERNVRNELGF